MTTDLATLSYLQKVFKGQNIAVVSQIGGKLGISAELDAAGNTPVLEGATGAAGNAQFALHLKEDVFTSPSQLPSDLTNTNADIGKYWLIDQVDTTGAVISSAAYIWYGTEFRVLPFGTQGPPGTYPVIAPQVSLLSPDENSDINVPGTGSAADPYVWQLGLAVPEGPAGPSAPLASFADVNMSVPPTVGQVLAFNGDYVNDNPVWQPMDVGDIVPQPYTIPESAFSSYAGIEFSSTQTVCTFAIPPNPWPWKPIVWGQMEMAGLELSESPLLIGVEVRVGNPTTGTLIARGFGNSLGGVVTIIPHTSSPSSTSTAMTPSNDVGLVAANHTGTEGTIYINLVNDGLAAVYDFEASNSQVMVLASAASSATVGRTATGSLGMKVTLSASTVTQGS